MNTGGGTSRMDTRSVSASPGVCRSSFCIPLTAFLLVGVCLALSMPLNATDCPLVTERDFKGTIQIQKRCDKWIVKIADSCWERIQIIHEGKEVWTWEPVDCYESNM